MEEGAPAGPVPPAAEPPVEVRGLSKVFRDFWRRPKVVALDGVDLSVRRGEVYGLLGPNGSGKSTCLKILLGLLHPTAGTVRVFGENAFQTRNKVRIGYLPESSCFYDHLSGRETLDFYARLLGLTGARRRDRIEELLHLVRLEPAAHRPVGEYSTGMLRRIGLAQALLADPELLILDEPTSGLDPVGMDEVQRLILDLRGRGKSILVSSHLLGEVEEFCDRVGVLFQGRMLAQGTLAGLLDGGDGSWAVDGAPAELERLREMARAAGIGVEFKPRRSSLKRLFLGLLDRAIQDVQVDRPAAEAPKPGPAGPDQAFLGTLTARPPGSATAPEPARPDDPHHGG